MNGSPIYDPSGTSKDPAPKKVDARTESFPSLVMTTVTLLLLLSFPVCIAYFAFELTPGRSAIADHRANVWLFGGLVSFTISQNLQMFLFALLLAGLGGFVGAVYNRASSEYLGFARRAGVYLIQTASASVVGVLVYILIRAGILTGNTVADFNPLGIAVLSLSVGISTPAILRLLRAAVIGIYGEQTEMIQAIQRLEERFESALSEPILDNYDGVVWVQIYGGGGASLYKNSSDPKKLFFTAFPGQRCLLEVHFGQTANHSTDGDLREELRIRNGKDVEEVTFVVTIDSLSIVIVKDSETISFPLRASPPPVVFEFDTPMNEGEHHLFVEISQKNRLLQSIPVSLRVEDDVE